MNIEKLSRSELIELNSRIITRLEFLDRQEVEQQKQLFHVGSPAEFIDGKGISHSCVVIKFNKKTVSVSTADGERWNIPADRLREYKPNG